MIDLLYCNIVTAPFRKDKFMGKGIEKFNKFALRQEWMQLEKKANKTISIFLMIALIIGSVLNIIFRLFANGKINLTIGLGCAISLVVCVVIYFISKSKWDENYKYILFMIVSSIMCLVSTIINNQICGVAGVIVSVLLLVLSIIYLNKAFSLAIAISSIAGQIFVYALFKTDLTVLFVRVIFIESLFVAVNIINRLYVDKINEGLNNSIFDPLTGLPNRMMFYDRLAQTISRTQRYKNMAAVIFIDLDGFKLINDTLGHEVGDELLIAVADRLRARVRQTDAIARIGGDEFIVILDEIKTFEEINIAAGNILENLKNPYMINGAKIIIGASMGIAVAPVDDTTIDGIIRKADMAMYLSKEKGKGCFSFSSNEIDIKNQKKMALVSRLSNALTNNEFKLFFQPQIEIEINGINIVGAEAFLRWQCPDSGLVSSADFIGIAEDSGLLIQIGKWVINEACKTIKEIEKSNPNFKISVNISAKQFKNTNFVEDVKEAVTNSNIIPSNLQLEITESVFLSSDAKEKLFKLKEIGVLIALDDFGTGYSSLSALHELPIDYLKIDKSFIESLHKEDNKEVAAAIISMSGVLQIETISEGVEDEKQLEYLVKAGGNLFQGYLFSHPVEKDKFVEMLKDGIGDCKEYASFYQKSKSNQH